LSESNSNRGFKKEILLFINDCIIPPFCIYNVIQNNQNSVGFLQGSYLNISKYLEYELFKKQFDYGLFTRILNQKKGKQNHREILFIRFSANQSEEEISLLKNVNKAEEFEALGFILFFSFGGKIKGLFECSYYLAVQKRKFVVFIKTKVKNIIRPKKN
jgi:hypothetical protein